MYKHTINSGIYIIFNEKSNRLYVGQSQNINKRWREHRKRLNENNHHCAFLQRAWNKYGEKAFEFKVLEYCPISELNKREQHFIDIYKARGILYNEALYVGASFRGKHHSEETRRKISEAGVGRKQSEETRQKRSQSMKGKRNTLGKKHSAETRQRMSESRSGSNSPCFGKSPSLETRQKMSASAKLRPPPMLGKRFTEEHRNNLSKSHKGKQLPLEQRKKIGDGIRRFYTLKRQENQDE